MNGLADLCGLLGVVLMKLLEMTLKPIGEPAHLHDRQSRAKLFFKVQEVENRLDAGRLIVLGYHLHRQAQHERGNNGALLLVIALPLFVRVDE